MQSYAYGGDFRVKKSSGIAVNVGTSLRVDSRADASQVLGLPCADPPMCHAPNTVQDKLYCERAVGMGYDSIQFARPHLPCLTAACLNGPPGWTSELVVCSKGCMSQTVSGACPPADVELRAVTWGAAPAASGGGEARSERRFGPCTCGAASDALNCGAGGRLYGRHDDGNQRCPDRLSSPELHEFFINQLLSPGGMASARRRERQVILRLLQRGGKPTAAWIQAVTLAEQMDSEAQAKGRSALVLKRLAAAAAAAAQGMATGAEKDVALARARQVGRQAEAASADFSRRTRAATAASQIAAKLAADADES